MKKIVSVFIVLTMTACVSFASTPIKISLWDKMAVPQDDTLKGLEIGVGMYTPNVTGIAWNLLFAKSDKAAAWQAGIVTITNNFKGLTTGLVNLNENEVFGVQCGIFNKAQSLKGLQFGFINMTENMQGIQIGLINFIKTGRLPVMIIANAKF